MYLFAVYLEKVHRPGNKAVLVHCIELPEFAKARMFVTYYEYIVILYNRYFSSACRYVLSLSTLLL